MKKIFLITAALMLVSSFAFCQSKSQQTQGIVFETGTFDQALAKAKTDNKFIFVDAYASWCQPCRRMVSEVFTQEKVGDYFNANFVNFQFDVEKGEGVKLAQRYEVDRFPTFLILDADGALVGKMIGGSPADDFIAQIQELVERGKVERE